MGTCAAIRTMGDKVASRLDFAGGRARTRTPDQAGWFNAGGPAVRLTLYPAPDQLEGAGMFEHKHAQADEYNRNHQVGEPAYGRAESRMVRRPKGR
jgi:hypothetical protein